MLKTSCVINNEDGNFAQRINDKDEMFIRHERWTKKKSESTPTGIKNYTLLGFIRSKLTDIIVVHFS